jgi:succinate-semialdehyde dehydrogenase/glutarate-semialdehyde dehydrogenase
MITRKAAPALAAGCTAVVKPSELTPFTALALAALAVEAGVPEGVLNVVTGEAQSIGAALCGSPAVRKLSFTGSTAVGKLLASACAPSVKKMALELGGNAPFIVFEDADLELALKGAMLAKFRHSGQTCITANRFLVQRPVYDEFVGRFAEAASKLKVGPGLADGVQIGPLINERAVAKVRAHFEDALERGAKALAGGTTHELGGTYFAPTVLKDVDPSMLVWREETFGPLAPFIVFDTEEEAIQMANDTPFGLAAYFYTSSLKRAFRVSEQIESGMVGINSGFLSMEVAPFGGTKESGIGREGSQHGMDEFLELKLVHLGLE